MALTGPASITVTVRAVSAAWCFPRGRPVSKSARGTRTSRPYAVRVIPDIAIGALLIAAAALAGVMVLAARRTATITLAGPFASAGELLDVDHGESTETVVVRRVMTDLTAGNVVLVRPYRRWHAVKWTRRWL